MNLEYYKNFLVAANELNFTQAAKKLYMTQQALSKQIESLEKTYHTRLFNREPPMSLTPSGECMYRNLSQIMDIEREMVKELDSLKGEEACRLSVGVSPRRSSVIIPALASAFMRQYPHVQIFVKENPLSKLIEALKTREVDCIFGYDLPDDPRLMSKNIGKEHTVIAVNKKLFEQYFTGPEQAELLDSPSHRLKAFERCPMIHMNSSTWLGNLFDLCCREENITPQITLESSNIFTVLICCVRGIGVAICPELYINQLTAKEREELHLFYWDYPNAQKDLAILYLKNSFLSQTTKQFINFSRSSFEECVNSGKDMT